MNIKTEKGFSQACTWTRNHLKMLRDGGVWAIPRSGALLRVDSHKELRISMHRMDAEPGVVAVIRSLGWQITPMEAP